MSACAASLLRLILVLCALCNLCLVSSTRYYVTRNDLKKRLDESKKSAKDPIHTSNSNSYFVEDGYGYDSHEMADYEHHNNEGYGYKDYPHRYMVAEKKHSKLFGDEISFVIVVVTLTVFFGILSSLLIPLTLLLINGGGAGGLLPFGGLNGILPVTGIGGVTPGIVGRRRRSAPPSERMTEYKWRFDTALGRFTK